MRPRRGRRGCRERLGTVPRARGEGWCPQGQGSLRGVWAPRLLPGLGSGHVAPAGSQRGGFVKGKAPGSGSMEMQGSPARWVAAVAAAQCPVQGTPQRGEAEAHGDPSPAGRAREGG